MNLDDFKIMSEIYQCQKNVKSDMSFIQVFDSKELGAFFTVKLWAPNQIVLYIICTHLLNNLQFLQCTGTGKDVWSFCFLIPLFLSAFSFLCASLSLFLSLSPLALSPFISLSLFLCVCVHMHMCVCVHVHTHVGARIHKN